MYNVQIAKRNGSMSLLSDVKSPGLSIYMFRFNFILRSCNTSSSAVAIQILKNDYKGYQRRVQHKVRTQQIN